MLCKPLNVSLSMQLKLLKGLKTNTDSGKEQYALLEAEMTEAWPDYLPLCVEKLKRAAGKLKLSDVSSVAMTDVLEAADAVCFNSFCLLAFLSGYVCALATTRKCGVPSGACRHLEGLWCAIHVFGHVGTVFRNMEVTAPVCLLLLFRWPARRIL